MILIKFVGTIDVSTVEEIIADASNLFIYLEVVNSNKFGYCFVFTRDVSSSVCTKILRYL